jgi:peptide methionine sulfoxide reductase MsrB
VESPARQKGAEPLAPLNVTRHEATERAFTGKYADNKEPTAPTLHLLRQQAV